MFYKESKNFLNEDELKIVNEYILSSHLPWYYQPAATKNRFPFFSHTIIKRLCDTNKEQPIPNSNIFTFFNQIFMRFCKNHNIKVKKITRACLNLIYPYYNNKYLTSDPHIDHEFKHKIFMIYLNTVSGDTIIYDKKYQYKKQSFYIEKIKKSFNILKLIKPEIGKCVCWNGEYYHAASFPKEENRRIVLVITFI